MVRESGDKQSWRPPPGGGHLVGTVEFHSPPPSCRTCVTLQVRSARRVCIILYCVLEAVNVRKCNTTDWYFTLYVQYVGYEKKTITQRCTAARLSSREGSEEISTFRRTLACAPGRGGRRQDSWFLSGGGSVV